MKVLLLTILLALTLTFSSVSASGYSSKHSCHSSCTSRRHKLHYKCNSKHCKIKRCNLHHSYSSHHGHSKYRTSSHGYHCVPRYHDGDDHHDSNHHSKHHDDHGRCDSYCFYSLHKARRKCSHGCDVVKCRDWRHGHKYSGYTCRWSGKHHDGHPKYMSHVSPWPLPTPSSSPHAYSHWWCDSTCRWGRGYWKGYGGSHGGCDERYCKVVECEHDVDGKYSGKHYGKWWKRGYRCERKHH